MCRLEMSVNNNMDRLWSIDIMKSNNVVALGYDEGSIVCTLGSDTPVASMQNGKIILNKNNEIQSANLKLVDMSVYEDGERIPLPIKDMGPSDIFPQKISHHPNGRFIVVCGDGEYIIYTAQALRSKSYGKALDFVWSFDGGYAIRCIQQNKIILYKNFTEYLNFIPSFSVEELFGGALLALKSSDCVCFYDWEECRFIRRIEVNGIRDVCWNENSEYVTLICDDSYFVLQYDKNAVAAAVAANVTQDDVGIEIAFELIEEVNEKVESSIWISNSFIYVTNELRLQIYTCGHIDTIAYLDRFMYILNYSTEQNKLFLIDKEMSVVSYSLHHSLLEYLSAISHKDFEKAETHFREIPENMYNKLAKFLEHLGHKEFALDVTKDSDHQFELAIQLGKLQKCVDIIQQCEEEYAKLQPRVSSSSSSSTLSSLHSSSSVTVSHATLKQNIKCWWKKLADLSLSMGRIDLSKLGYTKTDDYSALLLLYTSIGDEEGMKYVAKKAKEFGQINLSFLSFFLLNDLDNCIQVLLDAERYSEAAIFARTYSPSKIKDILPLWKNELLTVNEAVSDAVYDPFKNPEMFANFEASLVGEDIIRRRLKEFGLRGADEYLQVKDILEINLVNEIETHGKEEVENALLLNINGSSNPKDLLDDDNISPITLNHLYPTGASAEFHTTDMSSSISSSALYNNHNDINITNNLYTTNKNNESDFTYTNNNFSSPLSVYNNTIGEVSTYPYEQQGRDVYTNNNLSCNNSYQPQLQNAKVHDESQFNDYSSHSLPKTYEEQEDGIAADRFPPLSSSFNDNVHNNNNVSNQANVINTFLNDEWQSVHTHSSSSITPLPPPESNLTEASPDSNTPGTSPELADESGEIEETFNLIC